MTCSNIWQLCWNMYQHITTCCNIRHIFQQIKYMLDNLTRLYFYNIWTILSQKEDNKTTKMIFYCTTTIHIHFLKINIFLGLSILFQKQYIMDIIAQLFNFHMYKIFFCSSTQAKNLVLRVRCSKIVKSYRNNLCQKLNYENTPYLLFYFCKIILKKYFFS